MSDARPIGEILAPIVARAGRMASFQALINDVTTPEGRKQMIVTARLGDLITEDEARLLIEVYQLETA